MLSGSSWRPGPLEHPWKTSHGTMMRPLPSQVPPRFVVMYEAGGPQLRACHGLWGAPLSPRASWISSCSCIDLHGSMLRGCRQQRGPPLCSLMLGRLLLEARSLLKPQLAWRRRI